MRHLRLPLCVLLFTVGSALFAQDFGLLISQTAVFTDMDYAGYTAMAIPWFAAPLGESADMYLSAGMGAEYEYERWKPLPEVYRFELVYNPSAGLSFSLGRLSFRESLGWVMSGLFDGISAAANTGGGQLNAGVFYTGLLYKKSALISMSRQDLSDYYDDDVYFASRRLAAGVNWEKTSVFDSQGSLWLSGVCQFDLNDSDAGIHSQYLAAKFAAPLSGILNGECGACVEVAEETGIQPRAAFAFSAAAQWQNLGSLQDMLVLGGRFSSGDWNDAVTVFSPVTGEAQGRVLRPVLTGIAIAEAAYTARLHRTLYGEIFTAYLFRTDTVTYGAAGMDLSSGSPLLGGEFYLGLAWAPFTDLVFNLGGGVFLPQRGKAFEDDAKIKYRVELAAGFSL
ncbi:MAG: hypothetical protein FWH38_02980 [Treponema sp.]|nr:hypothetical protein [Treponema sp.]